MFSYNIIFMSASSEVSLNKESASGEMDAMLPCETSTVNFV